MATEESGGIPERKEKKRSFLATSLTDCGTTHVEQLKAVWLKAKKSELKLKLPIKKKRVHNSYPTKLTTHQN